MSSLFARQPNGETQIYMPYIKMYYKLLQLSYSEPYLGMNCSETNKHMLIINIYLLLLFFFIHYKIKMSIIVLETDAIYFKRIDNNIRIHNNKSHIYE